MTVSVDLVAAKKNLSEFLGDRMKEYLKILGSYFKRKISREEFDLNARKLLTMDSVHLHNQFLLAVLTKCQLMGTSHAGSREAASVTHASNSSSKSHKKERSSKRKRSGKVHHISKFLAVNPLSMAPIIQPCSVEQDVKSPGYLSREMVLPDISMVQGRVMVAAWDHGLDHVSDDVVGILMLAIQLQLKTILTAVMGRRSGYKLREGRFRHSMGAELPAPSLRNTVQLHDDYNLSEATSLSSRGHHLPSIKPSLITGLRDAATELTCAGDMPVTKYPMTLYDLYDTLQDHRSAIPCHAVYAINMERIIHKLWHPSHEDLQPQAPL